MKKSWGILFASVALVAAAVLSSVGPVGALAPPLAVTSITPNELAADITTTVVIQGTGFRPGAAVSFRDDGMVPATPSTVVGARVVSPTQIVALVRTGRPGGPFPNVEDVVVTNPGGGEAVLSPGLTVDVVPVYTQALPFAWPQGGTVDVTVDCTRCAPGAYATVSGPGVFVTKFDGTVPYHLTAKVAPNAPLGDRTLTIFTTNRGSVSTTVTIVPATLSVTSITPNELAADITTPVVIRGTGFQPGATVELRHDGMSPGSPSTVVSAHVVSPTVITALVHTGRPGGPFPILEDVVVTNPGGAEGVLSPGLTVDVVPVYTQAIPPQWARGSTIDVTVDCTRCAPGAAAKVSGPGVLVTRFDGTVPYHLTVKVAPTAPLGDRILTIYTTNRGAVSTTVTIVP